MITVYYWARHAYNAGRVFLSAPEPDEVLDHDFDLRSVSAPTREDLIEQLAEGIRRWSRYPMDAERAWQTKWRENAIAYIS